MTSARAGLPPQGPTTLNGSEVRGGRSRSGGNAATGGASPPSPPPRPPPPNTTAATSGARGDTPSGAASGLGLAPATAPALSVGAARDLSRWTTRPHAQAQERQMAADKLARAPQKQGAPLGSSDGCDPGERVGEGGGGRGKGGGGREKGGGGEVGRCHARRWETYPWEMALNNMSCRRLNGSRA